MKGIFISTFIVLATLLNVSLASAKNTFVKDPVDYVNPYIGNISHLLVPTFPTISLPNAMLRVYPDRENYTGNQINGLPIIVTNHRERSAFNLSPYVGDLSKVGPTIRYNYDNEKITPYSYEVDIEEYDIHVDYALSDQAAIYALQFNNKETAPYLIVNTRNGELHTDGKSISGFQRLRNNTKVYLYLETDIKPLKVGSHQGQNINTSDTSTSNAGDAYFIMQYPTSASNIQVRYGVSFISTEQAKKNLKREIPTYNLATVKKKGRDSWNTTLDKISVAGGTEDDKTVFYTSLYRTYERMINVSEDGKYFSAYDNKVHDDNGVPFFTDDWIWDTYLATHPLRVIIDPEKEQAMISSYLRMADEMDVSWMPNFPEVDGDSRRMNCNHAVAMVLDAYNKGLTNFDLDKAYKYSKAAITEKTLAPWSSKPAGVLDQFYKDHGYFPSLAKGENETVPEVHGWERRQPAAVTLGTVYDEWCLGNIAQILGNHSDAKYFKERAFNYRKIFNPETGFFHPKDTFGIFMENLDYRFPPGIGGRDAYDENTGYVYRFGVQHNIADLIALNGGNEKFVGALEDMFNTSLGKGRPDFYHIYADHTGNVGQYSMGNEPAMHIPYMYIYAGQPWRTQKRVRTLLNQWFRNDLMGIPGDEDGGGLTSFVVFSMIGFYPMTPGLPMYVIGSPVFESARVSIGKNKYFTVECENYAPENKYIQSATLDGKEWNKAWFTHEELMKGGTLKLVMGKYPNKSWAASPDVVPPSLQMK